MASLGGFWTTEIVFLSVVAALELAIQLHTQNLIYI